MSSTFAPVLIDGFEYEPVDVAESKYVVGSAGQGSPALLLHGFPENQYSWRKVAPRLRRDHTVVLCDLKGYGLSTAPRGGPRGEGYSKREMAAELVDVMTRFGFETFAAVGHDRGGRVGYRMALDFPERVTKLCALNIVPTVDQFERMTVEASLSYYPWLFLAQPEPFAETLVNASAEFFLRHTLADWTAKPDAIDEQAVSRYLATFTPSVVAAICADYRASFYLDRAADSEDRDAGRTIACPTLVHWGADDLPDTTLEVWRAWADDVRGCPLPHGHFVPEEAPEALVDSLRIFLA